MRAWAGDYLSCPSHRLHLLIPPTLSGSRWASLADGAAPRKTPFGRPSLAVPPLWTHLHAQASSGNRSRYHPRGPPTRGALGHLRSSLSRLPRRDWPNRPRGKRHCPDRLSGWRLLPGRPVNPGQPGLCSPRSRPRAARVALRPPLEPPFPGCRHRGHERISESYDGLLNGQRFVRDAPSQGGKFRYQRQAHRLVRASPPGNPAGTCFALSHHAAAAPRAAARAR